VLSDEEVDAGSLSAEEDDAGTADGHEMPARPALSASPVAARGATVLAAAATATLAEDAAAVPAAGAHDETGKPAAGMAALPPGHGTVDDAAAATLTGAAHDGGGPPATGCAPGSAPAAKTVAETLDGDDKRKKRTRVKRPGQANARFNQPLRRVYVNGAGAGASFDVAGRGGGGSSSGHDVDGLPDGTGQAGGRDSSRRLGRVGRRGGNHDGGGGTAIEGAAAAAAAAAQSGVNKSAVDTEQTTVAARAKRAATAAGLDDPSVSELADIESAARDSAAKTAKEIAQQQKEAQAAEHEKRNQARLKVTRIALYFYVCFSLLSCLPFPARGRLPLSSVVLFFAFFP